MTARYLSQMLRTPIHWGRGLVVGRERRANRLRLYRGLLLVAYLVMNLGLPTGLGPKVAVAAADKSCRCSAESRAAGRCCCSVRLGQKPRGCCVSPAASKEPATGRARLLLSRDQQATHIDSAAKTATKSCCAKKATAHPAESTVKPAEPSSDTSLAWTGACPCSPGGELTMLLCAHPRILISVDCIEVCVESRDGVSLLSQSPCGDRARPCVPPPEVSLV